MRTLITVVPNAPQILVRKPYFRGRQNAVDRALYTFAPLDKKSAMLYNILEHKDSHSNNSSLSLALKTSTCTPESSAAPRSFPLSTFDDPHMIIAASLSEAPPYHRRGFCCMHRSRDISDRKFSGLFYFQKAALSTYQLWLRSSRQAPRSGAVYRHIWD